MLFWSWPHESIIHKGNIVQNSDVSVLLRFLRQLSLCAVGSSRDSKHDVVGQQVQAAGVVWCT